MIHIGRFVRSFEERLAERNKQLAEVRARYQQLAMNKRLDHSSRLQARLRKYEHLLATPAQSGNGDLGWHSAVVCPLFEVIQRKLGKDFLAELHALSNEHVRLQFFNRKAARLEGFVVELVLKAICVEPLCEKVDIEVSCSPLPLQTGTKIKVVPLETKISDMLSALRAA